MVQPVAQSFLKGEDHVQQHLAQYHAFHRVAFVYRFGGSCFFRRPLMAKPNSQPD
jgi:hypothetical protein